MLMMMWVVAVGEEDRWLLAVAEDEQSTAMRECSQQAVIRGKVRNIVQEVWRCLVDAFQVLLHV